MTVLSTLLNSDEDFEVSSRHSRSCSDTSFTAFLLIFAGEVPECFDWLSEHRVQHKQGNGLRCRQYVIKMAAHVLHSM